MDQEQEDRRPTDFSEQPYKKQRPNTPPLQNPNEYEQQQAGRRKRRTRKASKKSRKASKKSRKARRYRR